MDKHYIILGKGYVGTTLATLFKSKNRPFTILSKKDLRYTDPQSLTTYLRGLGDSCEITIINCSGFTGMPNVDACEMPANKPQTHDLNALLPMTLGAVGKSLSHVNLLHISSGCIYNGYDKVYNEEDLPNFGIYNHESSFYAKTKHLGELALKKLNYGSILRVRMIYGSDNSERNFLNKIQKYSHLIIRENSMTNVDDLCNFILNFTEKNLERRHDVYNVVNEGSLSLRVVAALFNKYKKYRKTWHFVEERDLVLKANRSNCILDTSKIRALGMALPEVSLSVDNCIQKM